MADKAGTLPQQKRKKKSGISSALSSVSLRKSAWRLMPSLPKFRKSTQSLLGDDQSDANPEMLSAEKNRGECSSSSPCLAAPPGTPTAAAKQGLAQIASVAGDAMLTGSLTRTLSKGAKKVIPKFRVREDTPPLMVETEGDLHRSPCMDKNMLSVRQPAAAQPEEAVSSEADDVAASDGWSTRETSERLRKLSANGIRCSIFVDSEPTATGAQEEAVAQREAQDESVAPSAGRLTAGDPETLSVASSASLVSNPPSRKPSWDGCLHFGRKSPSTLKKEIIKITENRLQSESNRYIAEKLERRRSYGARQPTSKNDLLFKILVIGDLGTGKTSIIKRYVHQFFSQHYRATIGVDFAMKVLSWDDNTMIRLQLWDIAGQERFGNMTRVYYKEAVGAFIVFDVTRTSTYDAVLKWKQDLDSKVQLPDGQGIPCVLLANKCDQPKEGTVNSHSKMDEFCKQNKFISWFETSAKENINIDDAAHSLVSAILSNEAKKEQEREQPNLNGSVGVVSINPDVTPDNRSSAQKSCNFC